MSGTTEYQRLVAKSERAVHEDRLAFDLKSSGITFVRQFQAIKGRRFMFDFLVGEDLLVEVEGGVFSNGRHVRGKGFTDGCTKQALAVIGGWRVLRVTGEQVSSGEACKWILEAL